MSNKILVCVMCVAAACGNLRAESESGGAWRISVGPTFGGGLKSSLRVAPRTVPVYSAPAGSLSKSEAESKNKAFGSSRVELGGGYYIDPKDSVDDGKTWNYYLPAGSVDAQSHSFELVNSYVEVTESGRALSFRDKDETMDYGTGVMLEREVYRNGAFGVDVGGLVSWMMRNDAFRAAGTVGGQTVETGSYTASLGIDPGVNVNSPFFVNPIDGTYGYGSEDGPGYRISMDESNITRSWTQGDRSEINRMHVSMKGDYQEVELALLARPWYELTDWLRVVGTVGLGVSYARFALTTDVSVDGARTAHCKETFDDWDVYGVAGLGLMARYSNCCLGLDFLTKIGDDKLKVDARDAHGSLERERTTLRVYVGYEF